MTTISKYFTAFRECYIAAREFRNPLSVISRRLKFTKRYPFEIVTTSGLKFIAQSYHDLVTLWIVFCRSEYCVRDDAKIIVDLGANIGVFSIWAAHKNSQATIWAVEPFPRCVQQLNGNISANQLSDRITVIAKAVSTYWGEGAMNTFGPTQSNGLHPEGVQVNVDMVVVPTIPFNDLIKFVVSHAKQKIDFLKIDVEGGEHSFLLNGNCDQLEHVNSIGMEYHPNGQKELLFSSLRLYGFKLISDVVAAENSGVAHFSR